MKSSEEEFENVESENEEYEDSEGNISSNKEFED